MGFIYLLNMAGTDYYKVGITKRNIKQRISELQTGCPDEIILVNSYKCEHYRKLEGWLHRLYHNKRMEGEWFMLEESDIKGFINECEKGDETITLLINQNPFFK